jgi:hypothetical protein
LSALIVREGDLVEASGPVEADSRMCSPALGPLLIDTPCRWSIRVPGVEPTPGATVRGRWHPGRLSDIRRMPYSPPSTGRLGDSDLPDTPPCPAPAGGWRDGEDWFDEPVRGYVRALAEQFAEPFATHVGNARILVVEVVSGDVDQARAALRAIYTSDHGGQRASRRRVDAAMELQQGRPNQDPREPRDVDAHAHLGNLYLSMADGGGDIVVQASPDGRQRQAWLDIALRPLLRGRRRGRAGVAGPVRRAAALRWLGNRPFCRGLHGLALTLWRLQRYEQAEQTLLNMLWLNPADNQCARDVLPEARAHRPWTPENQ